MFTFPLARTASVGAWLEQKVITQKVQTALLCFCWVYASVSILSLRLSPLGLVNDEKHNDVLPLMGQKAFGVPGKRQGASVFH